MNGIKVYLKSSITKLYHYAQVVVGVMLVLDALRAYQYIEVMKLPIFLSAMAGASLVVGWVLPRSLRRKLRLLPGIQLVLGGLAMVFMTRTSMSIGYSHYNIYLLWIGYLITAFGMMQGLLDVNHVVYFNTEGMLYKSTLFYRIHKKWSEINGFVFQEDGFSVEFKNKRTLRMVPYDSESQNLRVYLDKMLLVAKSNAVANSEAEGTADPLRSKSLA